MTGTKDGKPKTAFDQLMKSGKIGAVRITNRLPLIFQVSRRRSTSLSEDTDVTVW